jgi:hypothetical protein
VRNFDWLSFTPALVAFSGPSDFNKTYSLVMNGITFRYLISLTAQKHLSLQLMDVVAAYFYESIDSDIYMPPGHVRSCDSEAFYMMNLDCNGGPEVSFYLLRVRV